MPNKTIFHSLMILLRYVIIFTQMTSKFGICNNVILYRYITYNLHQITIFLKVCVAFVFGYQILSLIDSSKIYQLNWVWHQKTKATWTLRIDEKIYLRYILTYLFSLCKLIIVNRFKKSFSFRSPYKRGGSNCLFNGGLAHNCDYR